MALQKLFLEKKAHQEKVGSSMSTRYCFDPKRNILTLFWKGEKCFQCEAKLGDAFVVNCSGSKPQAKHLQLPRGNADLLMWLFNFSKEIRSYSREEFEKILSKQRYLCDWWAYCEREAVGDKFHFVLSNRQDCGGECHIAAYVSDDICRDDVLEALEKYSKIRGMYYPKSFVKKVLKDRFSISEEEVKDEYFFLGGALR